MEALGEGESPSYLCMVLKKSTGLFVKGLQLEKTQCFRPHARPKEFKLGEEKPRGLKIQ